MWVNIRPQWGAPCPAPLGSPGWGKLGCWALGGSTIVWAPDGESWVGESFETASVLTPAFKAGARPTRFMLPYLPLYATGMLTAQRQHRCT